MKSILLLTVAAALTACSTTIYDPSSGRKLIRLESDATNVAYERTADGAITFTADQMSNSAPALAAGKVITSVVTAAGTAVSAVQAVKAYETINKPVVR